MLDKDKYKIHTVKIKNFKAFATEDTIILSGKHLLMYGENGSGKSSLYWSLYHFLQSSFKTHNTSEIFSRGETGLLNTNTEGTDDTAWVKVSFVNKPDEFIELSVVNIETQNTENNFLKNYTIASDFINHRLLMNFYDQNNINAINLFPIFAGEIFPYLNVISDKKYSDFYNDIIENKPYSTRRDGVIQNEPTTSSAFKQYQSKIELFNEKLEELLIDLNIKITDYYKNNFDENSDIQILLELTSGLEYDYVTQERKVGGTSSTVTSNDYKDFTYPFINLTIKRKQNGTWKKIHRPQSYLNEAKLTAVALSIRFSVLEKRLSDSPKILVLDDLLISLDMSNREKVLDLLFDKYAGDYQLLIFTHDRAFFKLAKNRTNSKFPVETWEYLEVYSYKTENEYTIPKIITSKDYLAKAEYYLDVAKDYPASANYLRKALEEALKDIIPESNRQDYKGEKATMVGKLLAYAKDYFKESGFDESILDTIAVYKDIVLNPFSHDNSKSYIYRIEIERTIEVIKKLKKNINKVIVPVNSEINFSIKLQNSKEYTFYMKLTNDIRLMKKHDEPAVYLNKISANTIAFKETSDVNITNYPTPFEYKRKSLEEIYSGHFAPLESYSSSTVIPITDYEENFKTEENKSIKEFLN